MKSSTILKRAKKLVWDGNPAVLKGNEFICHAIEDVEDKNLCWDKGREIRKEIEKRLSPYYEVETWLRRNVPEVNEQILKGRVPGRRHKISEQIQQYRLRWVDHLIKEYEARGD